MIRSRRTRRLLLAAAGILVAYLCLAYILLPMAWTHHEHQPRLADLPMVTRTAQGIPGDPLNVGLVGRREDVVMSMNEAGWSPADPVTLRGQHRDRRQRRARSALSQCAREPAVLCRGACRISRSKSPSGKSADRRHHVRFWLALDKGQEGRPVWLGAATFDRSVGFSHYTGAITHHIAPDVDAERDGLIGDLAGRRDQIEALYQVTGVGPTLNGRNGGGDRYFTDGEIHFARLVSDGKRDLGQAAGARRAGRRAAEGPTPCCRQRRAVGLRRRFRNYFGRATNQRATTPMIAAIPVILTIRSQAEGGGSSRPGRYLFFALNLMAQANR